MAATALPSLPPAPARSSPSTFGARMDGLAEALAALPAAINSRADYVEGLTADTPDEWVSGASYSAGDVVFSPTTFLTYRAATTHSGETTDPASDATNWQLAAGTDAAGQAALDLLTVGEAVDLDEAAIGYAFTAEGAITEGAMVTLRSDGTVEATGQSGAVTSADSPSSIGASSTYANFQIAYDATEEVFVAFGLYAPLTLDYPWVFSGVPSGDGSSITWTSEGLINTNDTTRHQITESGEGDGVFGLAWVDTTPAPNTAVVCLGEWSSGAWAEGTPVTASTATIAVVAPPAYSAADGKWVFGYGKGLAGVDGFASRVGTPSGLSLSLGTESVIEADNVGEIRIVFDSADESFLALYENDVDGEIQAKLGSISGTNVSWGASATTVAASGLPGLRSVAEIGGGRWFVLWNDGTALFGTVLTISGGSITVGTAKQIRATGAIFAATAGYDSDAGRVGVFFRDTNNSNYLTYVDLPISGSTITVGAEAVVLSKLSSRLSGRAIYKADDGRMVCAVTNGSDGFEQSLSVSPATTVTNRSAWLGVAQGGASDGETVRVKAIGAVDDNQSGLTPGSDYYVDEDGSLTTDSSGGILAGRALSATELLITGGNA